MSSKTKLAHGASRNEDGTLDFVAFGYNFRISEIQAALANAQLQKLEFIIKNRQNIYQHYCKSLIPLGFVPQKISDEVRYNVQSACFIVPADCDRDELIKTLKSHNIDSSIGTYSLSSTTIISKNIMMFSKTQISSKKILSLFLVLRVLMCNAL